MHDIDYESLFGGFETISNHNVPINGWIFLQIESSICSIFRHPLRRKMI